MPGDYHRLHRSRVQIHALRARQITHQWTWRIRGICCAGPMEQHLFTASVLIHSLVLEWIWLNNYLQYWTCQKKSSHDDRFVNSLAEVQNDCNYKLTRSKKGKDDLYQYIISSAPKLICLVLKVFFLTIERLKSTPIMHIIFRVRRTRCIEVVLHNMSC